MSSASNLALAMKVVAAAFMFALPVFLWVIKFGWEWQPAQFEDQLMIWCVYGLLGIQLIIGSGDLEGSRQLLNFTINSSIAHALVMTYLTLQDWDVEYHHVMPYGDVPTLFIFAGLLHHLKGKYDTEKNGKL
eukprot:gene18427-31068_t